jgi:hypothetical protein
MRSFIVLFALFSLTAAAQRVVLLDIDGDTQGKLRSQVESALETAGVVQIVTQTAYKEAAAKQKLRGPAAMTAEGVAKTARGIRFDAAVGGEVSGGMYKVLILDRLGEQLWSKDLPVKKGVLSDDFAQKLARAIAAAGVQGATRPPPNMGTEEPVKDENAVDLSGEPKPDEEIVVPKKKKNGRQVVAVAEEEQPKEERDEDLDDPTGKKRSAVAKKKMGEEEEVPLFRVWVAPTLTWRSQCVRPGVNACREYDVATPRPEGITIDFSASSPYFGVALNLDVFPLARFDNIFLQGFGLVGGFNFGASVTRIVEVTPQGMGQEKEVNSQDIGYSFQLAWRYHFNMGIGKPLPLGYAGIRGGLLSRSFNIDPTAGTALPSSTRVFPTGAGFPVIGIDAAIPIVSYFRFELSASFFVNPRTSDEQIVGYGNLMDATGGAVSKGFGFDAGFAGELIGPLGWMARVRYNRFTDTYYGQGQKWTVCSDGTDGRAAQCGGVAEESLTTIMVGLSAQF